MTKFNELTSIITKLLPNSYSYNSSYDAKDYKETSTYIGCKGLTLRAFQKLQKDLELKLKLHPSVKNFIILTTRATTGEPIPSKGMYVYKWDNKEEEIEAMTARVYFDMASLQIIQEQSLKEHKNLLDSVKYLVNLKRV